MFSVLFVALLGVFSTCGVAGAQFAAAGPLACKPQRLEIHNWAIVIACNSQGGYQSIDIVQPTTSTIAARLGFPFVSIVSLQETVASDSGDFNITDVYGLECTTPSFQQVGLDKENSTFIVHGTQCATSIPFQITVSASPLDDNLACVNVSIPSLDVLKQRPRLHLIMDEDEDLYGFGEQFTVLNTTGRIVPVFSREKGVGRGLQPITWFLDLVRPNAGGEWHTSYTHVPHYLTSHNHSFALTTYAYSVFNNSAVGRMVIETNSTDLNGIAIAGGSPKELISSYTAWAGRMPKTPTWANKGAILGLEGGTDAVKAAVDLIKRNASATPLAGVWMQDWSGIRQFPDRTGLW